MTEDLIKVRCPECEVLFGITRGLFNARVEDHYACFCPAGHSMNWPKQEPDLGIIQQRLLSVEARLVHVEDQLGGIRNDVGQRVRGIHAKIPDGNAQDTHNTQLPE
jgi:hypothetical protein